MTPGDIGACRCPRGEIRFVVVCVSGRVRAGLVDGDLAVVETRSGFDVAMEVVMTERVGKFRRIFRLELAHLWR